MAPKPKQKFLDLVAKVAAGKTARSENDLSSQLASYFQSLGLHTVIDTSGGLAGRKRPDIRAYVSAVNADLVLPAEIVVESKKPAELKAFPTLRAAMIGNSIWEDKTVPYIRENIQRIRYFALTNFTSFAIVTISPELRRAFASYDSVKFDEDAVKKQISAATTEFALTPFSNAKDIQSSEAWDAWCTSHLTSAALNPLPLSEVLNISTVATPEDLEQFATRLADVAAGSNDETLRDAGLFYSVRRGLGDDYAGLPGDVKRDLQIFLMTQHPGSDLETVEALAKTHLSESLDEFVAASVHSMVGRLFAYKSIEDSFCVGVEPSLIEPSLWVFNTNKYDGLQSPELLNAVFSSMRSLKGTSNAAISQLATNGIFYDWIANRIDPVLFRDLVEIFVSHDFSRIEGDLLGRFFEVYAQKVNRTKRRELGQYYTPQAIVAAMWRLSLNLAKQRCALTDIRVLDPGAGSGTFLLEGARVLERAGNTRFWEQLTGFDISVQVVGIAYVNLYVAILGLLDRKRADEVSDLAIFATDALDPKNGKYLRSILPLVTDEDYKAIHRAAREAERAGQTRRPF